MTPEVTASPTLSLFAGDGNIATRRIAIFVADGIDGGAAEALHSGLADLGAVPRYIGSRLGTGTPESGEPIEVEATFETMPSVLFDAAVVLDGKPASKLLGEVGHALEFLKDQYRHCKPILALGAGADLVENAAIPTKLPTGDADPGMLVWRHASAEEALPALVAAIAKHRHFERFMDPPEV